MTTATDVPTAVTTQVYRVYIRAPRERVWQAITDPEWTVRFGYGGRAEFDPDLRPGATYRGMLTDAMKERGSREGHPTPDVGVDGEILEVDPPSRLVQTFRMVMEPTMAAETEHISIPAHATWQAAGARPRTFPAGRVCERPGCSTVLSIYNRASVCSRHRVAKPRPLRAYGRRT